MPIRTPHPSPLPARGEGGERSERVRGGDRPRNLRDAVLSVALGIPGQLDHPDFRNALECIVAAAKRRGKSVGTLLRSAQDVAPAVRDGITFLGIASEATALANGIRAVVKEARTALSVRG